MTLLIMTVGTGTAGRHSNLAAGLRRTLDLLAPEAFWLIPSTDEVSLLTADLVREGLPGFQPWSDTLVYRAIEHPDSLEECRRAVREVILRARETGPRSARLLVNPTSGTKQMSVGAALAALDEGVGELVFTVGERADGVVKTGTEKLETFDASTYFAERDLNLARHLIRVGAPGAAARVLARHDTLEQAARVAECLHEWERCNYSVARSLAARCEALAPFRRRLDALAKAAAAPEPQAVLVRDLLDTAAILHRRGDYSDALLHTCRALETGLRLRLFQLTGLRHPYPLSELEKHLARKTSLLARIRASSRDGITCMLGLRLVAEVLRALGEPLGEDFLQSRPLQDLVDARNELSHSIRPVQQGESQSFLDRVARLLEPLALPEATPRPGLG